MRISSIDSHTRRAALAIAIAIVIGASAMSAICVRAAEAPAAVDQYTSALDAVMKSHSRQSLQPVFEIGIKSSPEVQAILDTLSAEELAALKKKMPGMQIVRGEIRRRSSERRLLQKSGTAQRHQSRPRIFRHLRPHRTRFESGFSKLRFGQACSARCTKFDGPLIVAPLPGMVGLPHAVSRRLPTEAQGELDSMDAELSAGTCACGTQQQVADGLEAFAKAFPDLPLTTKVRARIDRIKSGSSHIRFQCHG